MFSSPIEEIKNRLDIVDVVGGYLKLQKVGANLRALCPFHSEKTPSFFVSPARQIWRCFGCGLGGSVFDFVMQIEGVEFRDALRILAKKAGVELKKASPWVLSLETERKRLLEITELATQFFETQLEKSSSGKEAKDYLLKRGITEDSIKKWRIGYAPESAKALLDFLESRGYQKEEIGKAGLLLRVNGDVFDRFRSRIIFPVFDLNSQVIGFGGRIFGEKEKEKDIAKYINTSNTLLYDKSKALYGLDKAKLEIKRRDCAILVEGYTDVILVSQAGFENVVAVSGTALTIFHLKVLQRYSNNLLLAFDMDVGGDSATKRGIDLAIGEGFNVKVITMPESKDPADLVSEDQAGWVKATETAKSIFEFYFSSTLAKFDKKTPEGKKDIAKVLLPLIKRIPNRIEQSHWISILAKELEVKETDVEVELKKTREEPEIAITLGSTNQAVKAEPKTRKELLEERVLLLLFLAPQLLENIKEETLSLFSLTLQEILTGMKKNPTLDFNRFQAIFPQDTVEFLKHISLKSEVEAFENPREKEDVLQEFDNCIKELEHIHLKEELDRISREIKTAEEANDLLRMKQLLQQFQILSRNLHLSQ